MSRHLPPLLAVRAFEAAARHGSFSRAAEDLCVTAGAVGHQIKALEAWLDVPLFERGPRSVELTEAGRRYFGEVKAVLERLESCSQDIRRMAQSSEVTLTAMPSFVTRWLMPRLGGFQQAHPDIEVRVLASVPPVDFARDRVDLAIRLGCGPYPGLQACTLMHEYYVPVASPAFAARLGSSGPAQRLLAANLLHDEYEVRIPDQIDWPRWARAQGDARAHGGQWSRGMHFSHTYLSLEAATAGQGLAMASSVLAGGALLNGALSRLADVWLPGPYAYRLLWPADRTPSERVAHVISWIQREARQFLEAMHGGLQLPGNPLE